MNTNILVAGLLWSGSSAVVDLLSEYDEIVVLPGEFDEFRRPGMIADHIDGRISELYPSKVESYISQKKIRLVLSLLNTLISPSRWGQLNLRLIEFKRLSLLKDLKLSLADNPADIQIELVRLWLDSFQKLYGMGGNIVIDQPLLFGQHRMVWPKVFDPFKLIIVYRDPFDQFAEIIRQGHLFSNMRSPTADIYGGDREGAFDFQIETLKSRLIHIKSIYDEHGPGKVKIIKFDSLVKNYEESKNIIEEFIGVDAFKHKEKMVYFDPSRSMQNIGIYSKYLHESEVEKLEDLKVWINGLDIFNV